MRPLFSSSSRRRNRVFGPAVLLHDLFTDTNGTALGSHTMNVGAGWTVHTGSYTIQSNRAAAGADSADNFATADAGVGEAAGSCLVNLNGSVNGIGVILRFQDVSNFWLIDFAATFALYQVQAGVFTLRASTSPGLDAMIDHTITWTCNGTAITALVDGAHQISFSSSFLQSATRFGLKARVVLHRHDDFQVTEFA
jgi:hypothetical protein